MSNCLDESRVETVTIEYFRGLGYGYVHGPSIAPDGEAPELTTVRSSCRGVCGTRCAESTPACRTRSSRTRSGRSRGRIAHNQRQNRRLVGLRDALRQSL